LARRASTAEGCTGYVSPQSYIPFLYSALPIWDWFYPICACFPLLLGLQVPHLPPRRSSLVSSSWSSWSTPSATFPPILLLLSLPPPPLIYFHSQGTGSWGCDTCAPDGNPSSSYSTHDHHYAGQHAPTHTPAHTIRTAHPVWRARHLPFGRGVLSLPQRGGTGLGMYAFGGYLSEKDAHKEARRCTRTDTARRHNFPPHRGYATCVFSAREPR
jgi:hypothetical protein